MLLPFGGPVMEKLLDHILPTCSLVKTGVLATFPEEAGLAIYTTYPVGPLADLVGKSRKVRAERGQGGGRSGDCLSAGYASAPTLLLL